MCTNTFNHVSLANLHKVLLQIEKHLSVDYGIAKSVTGLCLGLLFLFSNYMTVVFVGLL